MNYLYKLVTTENIEINYDAFKKKELIECLATMRDIYFSLKQENKQLKAQIEEYQKALDATMSEKIDIQNNWNKLRDYVLKKQAILFDTEYTCYSNVLDKMQELEGSDSNVKK